MCEPCNNTVRRWHWYPLSTSQPFFCNALILMGRKPVCALRCDMTSHPRKVVMYTNSSLLHSRIKKPEIIACKWGTVAPWARLPVKTLWRPGHLTPISVKTEGIDNYCHVREEGNRFFLSQKDIIQDNTWIFSFLQLMLISSVLISLFKKQQTRDGTYCIFFYSVYTLIQKQIP